MKLRDYQQEAVDAVFAYWERAPSTPDRPASPLIVMPTGSGKSPTLGELVRVLVQDCGARVLVVTHRAELIKQDAKAIRSIFPGVDLGIFSAGLGRREVRQVTVAGIQSVYRHAKMLGHIDVIIPDECHLIPDEGGGQYQTLIKGLREINPDCRLVGLTATDYRLSQGYLTEGDGALFTAVAYSCDIKRLISGGYLSPVVTGYATAAISLESVGLRAGEFAAKDLEMASDVDKINDAVADDVVKALEAGRTSALVFGTSVAHAKRMRNALQVRGVSCETVTGETPREERDRIIDLFKARNLKAITSCDVLTTGFDAPVTDIVALVRPTMSPSLYVQMVGRGMRLADGKIDCLLLDYGGNIARHGPIDDVKVKSRAKKGDGEAPTKTCPQCKAVQAPAARTCLHCGYEWPAPVRKANDKASNLPALSIDIPKKPEKGPPEKRHVGRVEWVKHYKVGDDEAPPTLRVDYFAPGEIVARKIASEWVCVEHDEDTPKGMYARKMARAWWDHNVGTDMPDTVDEAIEILDAGYMKPVVAVWTSKEGKWDRVTAVVHGEPRQPGEDDDADSEPAPAVEADPFNGDDILF